MNFGSLFRPQSAVTLFLAFLADWKHRLRSRQIEVTVLPITPYETHVYEPMCAKPLCANHVFRFSVLNPPSHYSWRIGSTGCALDKLRLRCFQSHPTKPMCAKPLCANHVFRFSVLNPPSHYSWRSWRIGSTGCALDKLRVRCFQSRPTKPGNLPIPTGTSLRPTNLLVHETHI